MISILSFEITLVAIVFLVLASGFFSGSEVALFSLRRIDKKKMYTSTRHSEKLVYRLTSKPRRLIATILIGNEFVNVTLSSLIASRITTMNSWLNSISDPIVIAGISTLITLPVVLILGEVAPKTIAMKFPVAWAKYSSRPLWFFGGLVFPIRVVVDKFSQGVLSLFGIRDVTQNSVIHEDEFKAWIDAGNQIGEIDSKEKRLIHEMFDFGEKEVSEIMCKANDAFLLAYNVPLSKALNEISAHPFSRVPVYRKTRDNVLGVLYAKDLVLLRTGEMEPRPMSELLHEPLFITKQMRISRLFDVFKERKIHMAIIVDEYGAFIGLVTMEDVLEELFGPIRDEKELTSRNIENNKVLEKNPLLDKNKKSPVKETI